MPLSSKDRLFLFVFLASFGISLCAPKWTRSEKKLAGWAPDTEKTEDALHVIGCDDRLRLLNTSFPWSVARTSTHTRYYPKTRSAFGIVASRRGVCSGTLVGRRLVLTASHCIPYSEDGAGPLRFLPGYNTGQLPFGFADVKKVSPFNQLPTSFHFPPVTFVRNDHQISTVQAVCSHVLRLGSRDGRAPPRHSIWPCWYLTARSATKRATSALSRFARSG